LTSRLGIEALTSLLGPATRRLPGRDLHPLEKRRRNRSHVRLLGRLADSFTAHHARDDNSYE
jgi:hypothetical protein